MLKGIVKPTPTLCLSNLLNWIPHGDNYKDWVSRRETVIATYQSAIVQVETNKGHTVRHANEWGARNIAVSALEEYCCRNILVLQHHMYGPNTRVVLWEHLKIQTTLAWPRRVISIPSLAQTLRNMFYWARKNSTPSSISYPNTPC